MAVRLDSATEVVVRHVDGKVVAEVRVDHPDGSPRLYIPEGFPIGQVPIDMRVTNRTPDPLPIGVPVRVTASHSEQWGHWSSYRWGSLDYHVERAFWIMDRAHPGEKPWVWDMVGVINGAIDQNLKARGLSDDQTPRAAYWDDTANMGNCPHMGSNIPSFSWSYICTTWDIVWACVEPASGCAWVVDPTECPSCHHGQHFQPTAWIQAGLPEPYFRRNVVHHEIGHVLSWGHNTNESSSTMFAGQLPGVHLVSFHLS